MLKVTSSEIAKHFSRYRQAAQRGPVAVTHHGRVTEVLISKDDYDELALLEETARAGRPFARGVAENDRPFRDRLDSVAGTADGGLTTDEIMAMTRGEE
ncbi:MAG: type II toxin-antitoxin system prevent-host-death family antitoxin [Caulobacteraceae bacterium]